jgi:hypothetical protein
MQIKEHQVADKINKREMSRVGTNATICGQLSTREQGGLMKMALEAVEQFHSFRA